MSNGAGSTRKQHQRREQQFAAAEQLADTCPNLAMSRTTAAQLKTRALKARGWIAPDGTWHPQEPGPRRKGRIPKRGQARLRQRRGNRR